MSRILQEEVGPGEFIKLTEESNLTLEYENGRKEHVSKRYTIALRRLRVDGKET